MKLDDIFVDIGEFGAYQKRIFYLLCIPDVFTAVYITLPVIMLGVPPHRCAIPGYENDTFNVQDTHHQMWINRTIPAGADDSLLYDECHVFPANATYDEYNRPVNASVIGCQQWVYEESMTGSTLISELNLVCDKKFLPSVSKMCLFAGWFFGAILFGSSGDLFGRKRASLIGLTVTVAISIGYAWIKTFLVLVLMQLFFGLFSIGYFLNAFVLVLEFVGPSKRTWVGMVIEFTFPIGYMFLALLGYLFRQWRYIIMGCSFPTLLFFSYFWLIPESPRWLLSKGRVTEAMSIMRRAAQTNKSGSESLDDLTTLESTQPEKENKTEILRIFKSRILLPRSLIVFYNWVVVAMVYYGLSLNVGNLGGNMYLNIALIALAELVAYVLCLLLLEYTGRKKLHCFFMTLGGVACISTVFTTAQDKDLYVWTVVLAMVGKLGISACFAIIYLFTTELFPTVVRNQAMGISSCLARIGSMVSPFIADLNKIVPGSFGKALPLLVFGAFALAAGLFSIFLPETANKALPDTIEDAEQFGRSSKEKNKDDFNEEMNDISNMHETEKEKHA